MDAAGEGSAVLQTTSQPRDPVGACPMSELFSVEISGVPFCFHVGTFQFHLPLPCGVPSLVSHTIFVNTEPPSPFLSDFVHLPILLVGEFCGDMCPGHTSWKDVGSLCPAPQHQLAWQRSSLERTKGPAL